MKGLKVCYYLTFVTAGLSFGEGIIDFFDLRGETIENNLSSIVILILVGLINLGVCGYLNRYIKSQEGEGNN